MTPTGKIARLPLVIREQLNSRLFDGESGRDALAWLNSLPEVINYLKANYDGTPISDSNLSAWKIGGYESWIRQQEIRTWVQRLSEESADFKHDVKAATPAELLAIPVAHTLGRLLYDCAAGAPHDQDQAAKLLATARELTRLRRADQAERALQIKLELHQAAKDKAAEEHRAHLEELAEMAEIRAAKKAEWEKLHARITADQDSPEDDEEPAADSPTADDDDPEADNLLKQSEKLEQYLDRLEAIGEKLDEHRSAIKPHQSNIGNPTTPPAPATTLPSQTPGSTKSQSQPRPVRFS